MAMPTMVELYDKAIEIVRSGWTQGHSAIDAAGEAVRIDSPDAVRFCWGGSLNRAYHVITGQELYQHDNGDDGLLDRAYELGNDTVDRETRFDSLTGFNDREGRTVDEVIAMMEKAKQAA